MLVDKQKWRIRWLVVFSVVFSHRKTWLSGKSGDKEDFDGMIRSPAEAYGALARPPDIN